MSIANQATAVLRSRRGRARTAAVCTDSGTNGAAALLSYVVNGRPAAPRARRGPAALARPCCLLSSGDPEMVVPAPESSRAMCAPGVRFLARGQPASGNPQHPEVAGALLLNAHRTPGQGPIGEWTPSIVRARPWDFPRRTLGCNASCCGQPQSGRCGLPPAPALLRRGPRMGGPRCADMKRYGISW